MIHSDVLKMINGAIEPDKVSISNSRLTDRDYFLKIVENWISDPCWDFTDLKMDDENIPLCYWNLIDQISNFYLNLWEQEENDRLKKYASYYHFLTRRFGEYGAISIIQRFHNGESFDALKEAYDMVNDLSNLSQAFPPELNVSTVEIPIFHEENTPKQIILYHPGIDKVFTYQDYLDMKKENIFTSDITKKLNVNIETFNAWRKQESKKLNKQTVDN